MNQLIQCRNKYRHIYNYSFIHLAEIIRLLSSALDWVAGVFVQWGVSFSTYK